MAEVSGDFKVQLQDRNGDFHCWLNTSLMGNREVLGTEELDGFDKVGGGEGDRKAAPRLGHRVLERKGVGEKR